MCAAPVGQDDTQMLKLPLIFSASLDAMFLLTMSKDSELESEVSLLFPFSKTARTSLEEVWKKSRIEKKRNGEWDSQKCNVERVRCPFLTSLCTSNDTWPAGNEFQPTTRRKSQRARSVDFLLPFGCFPQNFYAVNQQAHFLCTRPCRSAFVYNVESLRECKFVCQL